MTNEKRADYASRVMDYHLQYFGDNQDDDVNLIDLLTNFMHWCDDYAVNFQEAVRIAQTHYESESPL